MPEVLANILSKHKCNVNFRKLLYDFLFFQLATQLEFRTNVSSNRTYGFLREKILDNKSTYFFILS